MPSDLTAGPQDCAGIAPMAVTWSSRDIQHRASATRDVCFHARSALNRRPSRSLYSCFGSAITQSGSPAETSPSRDQPEASMGCYARAAAMRVKPAKNRIAPVTAKAAGG